MFKLPWLSGRRRTQRSEKTGGREAAGETAQPAGTTPSSAPHTAASTSSGKLFSTDSLKRQKKKGGISLFEQLPGIHPTSTATNHHVHASTNGNVSSQHVTPTTTNHNLSSQHVTPKAANHSTSHWSRDRHPANDVSDVSKQRQAMSSKEQQTLKSQTLPTRIKKSFNGEAERMHNQINNEKHMKHPTALLAHSKSLHEDEQRRREAENKSNRGAQLHKSSSLDHGGGGGAMSSPASSKHEHKLVLRKASSQEPPKPEEPRLTLVRQEPKHFGSPRLLRKVNSFGSPPLKREKSLNGASAVKRRAKPLLGRSKTIDVPEHYREEDEDEETREDGMKNECNSGKAGLAIPPWRSRTALNEEEPGDGTRDTPPQQSCSSKSSSATVPDPPAVQEAPSTLIPPPTATVGSPTATRSPAPTVSPPQSPTIGTRDKIKMYKEQRRRELAMLQLQNESAKAETAPQSSSSSVHRKGGINLSSYDHRARTHRTDKTTPQSTSLVTTPSTDHTTAKSTACPDRFVAPAPSSFMHDTPVYAREYRSPHSTAPALSHDKTMLYQSKTTTDNPVVPTTQHEQGSADFSAMRNINPENNSSTSRPAKPQAAQNETCPTSPTSYRRMLTTTSKAMSALGENNLTEDFRSTALGNRQTMHSPRRSRPFSPPKTTNSHVVWPTNKPRSLRSSTSPMADPGSPPSKPATDKQSTLMSYKQKILEEWKNRRRTSPTRPHAQEYSNSSSSSVQSLDSYGRVPNIHDNYMVDQSRSSSSHSVSSPKPGLTGHRQIPKQASAPSAFQPQSAVPHSSRPRLITQTAIDAGDSDVDHTVGTTEAKPASLCDANQDCKDTQNIHASALIQDDSFNRPESPIYEPMSLPTDSVIKRHRQRRHSDSSTDSEAFVPLSPRVSPRVARRQRERMAVGSDSSSVSLEFGSRNGMRGDGRLHVPDAYNFGSHSARSSKDSSSQSDRWPPTSARGGEGGGSTAPKDLLIPHTTPQQAGHHPHHHHHRGNHSISQAPHLARSSGCLAVPTNPLAEQNGSKSSSSTNLSTAASSPQPGDMGQHGSTARSPVGGGSGGGGSGGGDDTWQTPPTSPPIRDDGIGGVSGGSVTMSGGYSSRPQHQHHTPASRHSRSPQSRSPTGVSATLPPSTVFVPSGSKVAPLPEYSRSTLPSGGASLSVSDSSTSTQSSATTQPHHHHKERRRYRKREPEPEPTTVDQQPAPPAHHQHHHQQKAHRSQTMGVGMGIGIIAGGMGGMATSTTAGAPPGGAGRSGKKDKSSQRKSSLNRSQDDDTPMYVTPGSITQATSHQQPHHSTSLTSAATAAGRDVPLPTATTATTTATATRRSSGGGGGGGGTIEHRVLSPTRDLHDRVLSPTRELQQRIAAPVTTATAATQQGQQHPTAFTSSLGSRDPVTSVSASRGTSEERRKNRWRTSGETKSHSLLKEPQTPPPRERFTHIAAATPIGLYGHTQPHNYSHTSVERPQNKPQVQPLPHTDHTHTKQQQQQQQPPPSGRPASCGALSTRPHSGVAAGGGSHPVLHSPVVGSVLPASGSRRHSGGSSSGAGGPQSPLSPSSFSASSPVSPSDGLRGVNKGLSSRGSTNNTPARDALVFSYPTGHTVTSTSITTSVTSVQCNTSVVTIGDQTAESTAKARTAAVTNSISSVLNKPKMSAQEALVIQQAQTMSQARKTQPSYSQLDELKIIAKASEEVSRKANDDGGTRASSKSARGSSSLDVTGSQLPVPTSTVQRASSLTRPTLQPSVSKNQTSVSKSPAAINLPVIGKKSALACRSQMLQASVSTVPKDPLVSPSSVRVYEPKSGVIITDKTDSKTRERRHISEDSVVAEQTVQTHSSPVKKSEFEPIDFVSSKADTAQNVSSSLDSLLEANLLPETPENDSIKSKDKHQQPQASEERNVSSSTAGRHHQHPAPQVQKATTPTGITASINTNQKQPSIHEQNKQPLQQNQLQQQQLGEEERRKRAAMQQKRALEQQQRAQRLLEEQQQKQQQASEEKKRREQQLLREQQEKLKQQQLAEEQRRKEAERIKEQEREKQRVLEEERKRQQEALRLQQERERQLLEQKMREEEKLKREHQQQIKEQKKREEERVRKLSEDKNISQAAMAKNKISSRISLERLEAKVVDSPPKELASAVQVQKVQIQNPYTDDSLSRNQQQAIIQEAFIKSTQRKSLDQPQTVPALTKPTKLHDGDELLSTVASLRARDEIDSKALDEANATVVKSADPTSPQPRVRTRRTPDKITATASLATTAATTATATTSVPSVAVATSTIVMTTATTSVVTAASTTNNVATSNAATVGIRRREKTPDHLKPLPAATVAPVVIESSVNANTKTITTEVSKQNAAPSVQDSVTAVNHAITASSSATAQPRVRVRSREPATKAEAEAQHAKQEPTKTAPHVPDASKPAASIDRDAHTTGRVPPADQQRLESQVHDRSSREKLPTSTPKESSAVDNKAQPATESGISTAAVKQRNQLRSSTSLPTADVDTSVAAPATKRRTPERAQSLKEDRRRSSSDLSGVDGGGGGSGVLRSASVRVGGEAAAGSGGGSGVVMRRRFRKVEQPQPDSELLKILNRRSKNLEDWEAQMEQSGEADADRMIQEYENKLEAQKAFKHQDIPVIDAQLEQAFKSRRSREGSESSTSGAPAGETTAPGVGLVRESSRDSTGSLEAVHQQHQPQFVGRFSGPILPSSSSSTSHNATRFLHQSASVPSLTAQHPRLETAQSMDGGDGAAPAGASGPSRAGRQAASSAAPLRRVKTVDVASINVGQQGAEELMNVLKNRRSRPGLEDDVEESENKAEEEKQKRPMMSTLLLSKRRDSLKVEESTESRMSVQERIFSLQSRADEASEHQSNRSSGYITPRMAKFKSAISGSITSPTMPLSPCNEAATTSAPTTHNTTAPTSGADGGDSILTDSKLLDKLADVALTRDVMSARRQKYLARGREDWRVHTQPVTGGEMDQLAQQLDSLEAFRTEINKKASMNVFNQPKPKVTLPIRKVKGQETFPQPFQKEKLDDRRRKGLRYKTMPVTTGELMKIPEFVMNGSHYTPLTATQQQPPHHPASLEPHSLTATRGAANGGAAGSGPAASPSPARQVRKECRRKVEQARAKQQGDSDSDLDAMVETNRGPPLPTLPPPRDAPRASRASDSDDDNDHEKDEQCRMSLAEKMAFFNRKETEGGAQQPKSGSHGNHRRFHDRRRRFERARTQPITEEDCVNASELARIARSRSEGPLLDDGAGGAGDKAGGAGGNRAMSMEKEVGEHSHSSEEDQLSKLSLMEKMKLFSGSQHSTLSAQHSAAGGGAGDRPVLRRRGKRVASRFKTQPVTQEEVDKAKRISPLALSLVAPPDPEKLAGLSLREQREMMIQHAQDTLNQLHAANTAANTTSAAATANGAAANATEDQVKGILKSSNDDTNAETSHGILKSETQSSLKGDGKVRGILKSHNCTAARPRPAPNTDPPPHGALSSRLSGIPQPDREQRHGILKRDSDPAVCTEGDVQHLQGILKHGGDTPSDTNHTATSARRTSGGGDTCRDERTLTADADRSHGQHARAGVTAAGDQGLSVGVGAGVGAGAGGRRGILKEPSFEVEAVSDVQGILKHTEPHNANTAAGATTNTTAPQEEDAVVAVPTAPAQAAPVHVSPRERVTSNHATHTTPKTSVQQQQQQQQRVASSPAVNGSASLAHAHLQRQVTTPAGAGGEGDLSPASQRKLKRAVTGRSITEPLPDTSSSGSAATMQITAHQHTTTHTPTPHTSTHGHVGEGAEVTNATTDNSPPDQSSSIQNRLTQLQKSGEEGWMKRISKEPTPPGEAPQPISLAEVKYREKPEGEEGKKSRPTSIAERLKDLQGATDSWKGRVEQKDVAQFTVEGKLTATGKAAHNAVDSPLMMRKKRVFKTPLNRDSPSPDPIPPMSPSKLFNGGRSQIPSISETAEDPSASAPTIPLGMTASDIESDGGDSDSDGGPKEVSLMRVDDVAIDSFFTETTVQDIKQEEVQVQVDDFDQIFLDSQDILPSVQKVRPQRRTTTRSKNPLKTLAARQDLNTSYREVKTNIAEKEMTRIKKEQISGQASYATEALAGLATKEDFAKVNLRKTQSFGGSTPGSAGKFEPYHDLMLIHVKGRRHCQMHLVAPQASSINSGDCYILVTADKVIVWVGEFCNVIEKAKALEAAAIIVQKHDLGCKSAPEPFIVHEANQSHGAGSTFWQLLGGKQQYQETGPAEEDELYEMYMSELTRVYRLVSDKLVPVPEYSGCVPRYDMLNSKHVMVFDFGSEMYMWTGRQAPFHQRKVALRQANDLWSRSYDYSGYDLNPLSPLLSAERGGLPMVGDRPEWALFAKVNENMETVLFREKFLDWPDASRLIKVKGHEAEDKSEQLPLTACDVNPMLSVDMKPVTLVLEGSNVGRGSTWTETHEGLHREYNILTLDVTVWHVLEYDHFKLDAASHGQFHNGDTYVVRWHYMITQTGMKDLKGNTSNRHSLTGRERCAYFFWQGSDSSITEKGASALMTVELDEERGPQVRVTQGKEQPCFVNLFKGSMIVHIGKREEENTNTQGPYRLYQVRNELPNEAYLVEVECITQNLRSRGCLLLLNVQTGKVVVWNGVKAAKHTRQRAQECAEALAKTPAPPELNLAPNVTVTITSAEEGTEPLEFWNAMETNDRRRYFSLLPEPRGNASPSSSSDTDDVSYTARLFYLSSVSGVFKATEIVNPTRNHQGLTVPFPFRQQDLYKLPQPALLLLDVESEVYLWQGWWPQGTTDQQNVKTGSATARLNTDRMCAMETILNYCNAKNHRRPPPAYLVYGGLEPLEFTNFFPHWEHDYDAEESNLGEGKQPGEKSHIQSLLEKMANKRYTFEELQQRPLPEGVDPMILETYLHDQEFQEKLGVSRTEYLQLPSWKQSKLKKAAGLF